MANAAETRFRTNQKTLRDTATFKNSHRKPITYYKFAKLQAFPEQEHFYHAWKVLHILWTLLIEAGKREVAN